jgi:hypothetical protein
VDDHRGLQVAKELHHNGAIADIHLVVNKTGQFFDDPMLVPARVALRPKENRTLVLLSTPCTA